MADTTPVNFTPEIIQRVNTALVSKRPITVAYVDESGQPMQNSRGAVVVFSRDRLAMWIRNPEGGLASAIAKNPKVCLMFRNGEAREEFAFRGRAHVSPDEAGRKKVYSEVPQVERDHDPAMRGVVVIVDVDRVDGFIRDAAGEIVRVDMKR